MLAALAATPVEIVDQGTDWPGWITAIAGAITLVVVVVTAVFALLALRDSRRTRHAQLISDLTRDWTDNKVIRANELHGSLTESEISSLIERIFNPDSPPADRKDLHTWTQIVLVANLIEALGVLESEKALTAKVIYKMWGGVILTAWPKWDDPVRKLRIYDGEPDTFQYFEALATKIQAISEKRKRVLSRSN